MSRHKTKAKSKAKAKRASDKQRPSSLHLPKHGSALTPGPLAAVAAAPLAVGQPATATAAEIGPAPPQAAVSVEGRLESGDVARPPRAFSSEPIAVASARPPHAFVEDAELEHPDQLFSALELDFFKRAEDLYTQVVSDGETWDDLEPAHATPVLRARLQ